RPSAASCNGPRAGGATGRAALAQVGRPAGARRRPRAGHAAVAGRPGRAAWLAFRIARVGTPGRVMIAGRRRTPRVGRLLRFGLPLVAPTLLHFLLPVL